MLFNMQSDEGCSYHSNFHAMQKPLKYAFLRSDI